MFEFFVELIDLRLEGAYFFCDQCFLFQVECFEFFIGVKVGDMVGDDKSVSAAKGGDAGVIFCVDCADFFGAGALVLGACEKMAIGVEDGKDSSSLGHLAEFVSFGGGKDKGHGAALGGVDPVLAGEKRALEGDIFHFGDKSKI